MPNKQDMKSDLTQVIPGMCSKIARLDPGSLARLRRMDPAGPGEAGFWKLAVSHGFRTDQYGMMLVKLLAILTPKGKPGEKQLHDRSIQLGKLLATGKNNNPLLKNNNPLLSETRLLRFIALPFDKRPESLERICRLIAANGHKGVDCVELARLLFFDDVKHTRHLARSYFSNPKQTSNEKDKSHE